VSLSVFEPTVYWLWNWKILYFMGGALWRKRARLEKKSVVGWATVHCNVSYLHTEFLIASPNNSGRTLPHCFSFTLFWRTENLMYDTIRYDTTIVHNVTYANNWCCSQLSLSHVAETENERKKETNLKAPREFFRKSYFSQKLLFSYCQIWWRCLKRRPSYILQVEDWKWRLVSTLNFYLDLWKLKIDIWHGCCTYSPNFMRIGLLIFEKSERTPPTNDLTNTLAWS